MSKYSEVIKLKRLGEQTVNGGRIQNTDCELKIYERGQMVHSDTSADSFVKNKNICLKPQKAKNTKVIILVYYTLN